MSYSSNEWAKDLQLEKVDIEQTHPATTKRYVFCRNSKLETRNFEAMKYSSLATSYLAIYGPHLAVWSPNTTYLLLTQESWVFTVQKSKGGKLLAWTLKQTIRLGGDRVH